ncbi:MAG: hypothetical protein Q8P30_00435 [Candidatus Uhrbacteria bacterium]|nr:hypothetical protein [Candidatus Uhrbacteria bacterium]
MTSSIEKDIYRTIAYFAYFGYPLTQFEIWKWMLQPARKYSLVEVLETLESSIWLNNEIEAEDGFFGMHGRFGGIEDQICMKHSRFLNAIEKHRKLKKVLKYVARIPTVRGVAMCNSLVFHHTKQSSDIDLFVITEEGRVWTTRLLAVTPMKLLRQRPGEAGRDAVDMSFFADPSALCFEALKIDNNDPYMSMWIRSLVPLYECESGVFSDFEWKNKWASDSLPNTTMRKQAFADRLRLHLRFPHWMVTEKTAQKFQQRQMPNELSEMANKNTCVVIRDNLLKFHKNDRRVEIAEALNEKIKICE